MRAEESRSGLWLGDRQRRPARRVDDLRSQVRLEHVPQVARVRVARPVAGARPRRYPHRGLVRKWSCVQVAWAWPTARTRVTSSAAEPGSPRRSLAPELPRIPGAPGSGPASRSEADLGDHRVGEHARWKWSARSGRAAAPGGSRRRRARTGRSRQPAPRPGTRCFAGSTSPRRRRRSDPGSGR